MERNRDLLVDALVDQPLGRGAEEGAELAAALGRVSLVHEHNPDLVGARRARAALVQAASRAAQLPHVACHADQAGAEAVREAVGGAHVALQHTGRRPCVLVEVQQHRHRRALRLQHPRIRPPLHHLDRVATTRQRVLQLVSHRRCAGIASAAPEHEGPRQRELGDVDLARKHETHLLGAVP